MKYLISLFVVLVYNSYYYLSEQSVAFFASLAVLKPFQEVGTLFGKYLEDTGRVPAMTNFHEITSFWSEVLNECETAAKGGLIGQNIWPRSS